MSWPERTRDRIEFISPLRKQFFGFWRQDPREKARSLSARKYPGVDGVFVQDTGVGGVSYPLNFFFSGDNHDLEAERFFQACDEKGAWQIIHPTLGKKENMRLTSISQNISRTEAANTSEFSSVWLESIPEEKIVSRPDATESLRIQSTIINDLSSEEFNRATSQETAVLRQTTVNTLRSLAAKIQSGLAALYELNAEINSRINAIQRAVNQALNEVILRPLALAAQFQRLIQLPALALNDIQARLDNYKALADDILTLSPDNSFIESKNTAACLEMNLTAVLAVSAQSLISGPLATRREAIELAEFLLTLFEDVTDGLDSVEELFEDRQADRQYFSQTDSFSQLAAAIAEAVNSVIQTSFDLKIEKRFIIDRPRAPIEITITEYGELGENDVNLDLFYSSNKLSREEMILLPADKEVVVYV